MAKGELRTYTQKRDFERTAEPRGVRARTRTAQLSYVIQRHHASHLHFDFRLELDGVLKSWAVPKGPSLSPAEKRLAVEVEDHPLKYGSFEGSIPHGEYGGGRVLVWDKGVWKPEGDPHDGLKKGRLKFVLDGERLHGGFTLVRMHPRPGEKKHNWLLIKERDRSAREGKAAEVTAVAPVPPLASFHAQLATLEDALPTASGWGYEIKLDGYRALASVDGGKAKMLSRDHKEWTARFPLLVKALQALPVENAVVDGEVCAVDPDGRTRFQDLQNALSLGDKANLMYFVFDLLFLDGFDLRDRPLAVRKAMLASLLDGVAPPLAYVTHLEGAKEAQAVLGEACRRDLEGMVAKRLDRPHHGGRSPEWVKVKCSKRQEFVIVGYTKAKGSRSGFGALLLGVHDKGHLRYVGKVGTGFSTAMLGGLATKLGKMVVKDPPVVAAPRLRDATWVKPVLVGEVSFSEWTHDGSLRHPSFIGMREDKGARDVMVEEKAPVEPESKPKKKAKADLETRVGNIAVTHPTRVIDPSTGTTKLDLVRYQEAVAEAMVPYADGRPLALVRCVDAIGPTCFFQKKKSPGMGDAIHATRGNGHDVLYVDSTEGLVSLVQFGTVEIHGWGARRPALAKPDWIVMDLDPDEGLPFARVVDAALEMRELFKTIGLESFVKTTGGKGLHVVAPIVPTHGWDAVKSLAESMATNLESGAPERYTANMAKKKRTGKIFVDYLRNGVGATAVLPYSSRNRPGLPVAMPIAWTDVRNVDPHEFTVATVPAILRRRKKDPWGAFFGMQQDLPASLSQLVRTGAR